MGEVIHWELCRKLKFDHMNKWDMQNPESVLENETHKLLWDFEIQTNHQILARQPDFIIINKKEKTCKVEDFSVPVDHRVILKECEKRDNYLDLARELKKQWNMKVTLILIVIGVLGTGERTKGLGNNRTGGDCLNYSIVVISQKTEKTPGDLKRLAITQTPVKNHQLTLTWKTFKE